MFRIAALFVTIFLVMFSYFYSHASLEQQQRMPEPLRVAATEILVVLTDLFHLTNEGILPRLQKGFDKAVLDAKDAAGYGEKPVEGGVLAMNKDLTGTDYSSQLIPNSTFTRAKLDNVNWTKTYLNRSAFDSASMTKGVFNQTILTNASARGADFSGSNLNDADLTGSMAQGAVFDDTNINVTLLSSAQFSGASFVNANIAGSYGDKSIFFSADFTGANISNSDFTKATLDKAVFHKAVLFETHLEKASLVETDFSGADLSMVTGLKQKQLNHACGDEMTKLPDGLTIPSCHQQNMAHQAALEQAGTKDGLKSGHPDGQ